MPNYELTADGFVARAFFVGPRAKVETAAARLGLDAAKANRGRKVWSIQVGPDDRVRPDRLAGVLGPMTTHLIVARDSPEGALVLAVLREKRDRLRALLAGDGWRRMDPIVADICRTHAETLARLIGAEEEQT
jgi:hypothetical protein